MNYPFNFDSDQASLISELLKEHSQALKNWTATAVENGEFDRAKELVADLRAAEDTQVIIMNTINSCKP